MRDKIAVKLVEERKEGAGFRRASKQLPAAQRTVKLREKEVLAVYKKTAKTWKRHYLLLVITLVGWVAGGALLGVAGVYR